MKRIAFLAALVLALVVACNPNPTPPGAPPPSPPPASPPPSPSPSPPPGPPAPPPPPTQGQLQVTVNGLDIVVAGSPRRLSIHVPAAIVVKAPSGSSQTVTDSTTLNNLQPGAYTITASEVTNSVYTFKPQPSTQTLAVTAGQTTSATVDYAAISGAIELQIGDLLNGQKSSIAVIGLNDTRHVSQTTTLADLAPGDYTFGFDGITPNPQAIDNSAGFYYDFSLPQKDTVRPGETAFDRIDFTPRTGSLDLTIDGLPANVDLDEGVIVFTTNNGGEIISKSSIANYLTPGPHKIEVDTVHANGFTYQPTSNPTSVTIASGQIAPLHITYTPIDSKLNVAVKGLPSGQNRVRVTGPDGFNSGPFGTNQTFFPIAPGAYTVTAQGFTVGQSGKPGCRVYTPDAATQTATLLGGQTTTATVTYSSELCEI